MVLTGTVIRGDGRGRRLGFPTANLTLSEDLTPPAEGVYACQARIQPDATIYKGALHVGPRPTFAGAQPSIEVHLLDFSDRDLYDEHLELTGLIFIRPVKKFSSVEELISAIQDDCERVRQLLS